MPSYFYKMLYNIIIIFKHIYYFHYLNFLCFIKNIRTFQSFRNAEKEMKALDALLKLELNRDERPTVIEITDLTQEQKEIIDRKVKAFLLENNV